MPPLHDPHDTIIRKVLLYATDAEQPCLVSKEFSEAASEVNPFSIYTTSVDLRSNYGKYIHTTRAQTFNMENQELKHNEGEYIFYFNMSVDLPINRCTARVAGVDLDQPTLKDILRGDVVVVKTEEWPGPLVVGGGAHMNYLDVHLSCAPACGLVIKEFYKSNQLGKTLEDDLYFHRRSVKQDRHMRWLLEMTGLGIPLPTPHNLGGDSTEDKARS
ncbi:hypothetical protein BDQ12DRAFT_723622 [Crucibulum laeve]|uniref:Uncharacterized protein n=1 Tax=Crucibulum laeve TaxID=68775 RepID=A0A5C3M1T3_9AGAR|nr:hypothetical protein BDQ12DRAFT_723622 [Crucibulum laeve]